MIQHRDNTISNTLYPELNRNEQPSETVYVYRDIEDGGNVNETSDDDWLNVPDKKFTLGTELPLWIIYNILYIIIYILFYVILFISNQTFHQLLFIYNPQMRTFILGEGSRGSFLTFKVVLCSWTHFRDLWDWCQGLHRASTSSPSLVFEALVSRPFFHGFRGWWANFGDRKQESQDGNK